MKRLAASLFVITTALMFTPAVAAGAPDGAGAWADEVVTTSQGMRKDGSPVLPIRSNPGAALGVAESNTVPSNFYSLGFGGSITLRFDNPISDGVVVVEATNLPYPTETALVELSADGSTWLTAGTVAADGAVNMPERLSCARFVRVTDTSNAAGFPDDADGYDVDGVGALAGIPCETPDVPEFGTVTAAMATLMSGGVFLGLRKKLGLG